MDGWFKAVNAKTGELLWKHKLPSGTIGNPMTFTGPDGKQYVAIYSGSAAGSGFPWQPASRPTTRIGALGAVGVAYGSGLDKATTRRRLASRVRARVVSAELPAPGSSRPAPAASRRVPVKEER